MNPEVDTVQNSRRLCGSIDVQFWRLTRNDRRSGNLTVAIMSPRWTALRLSCVAGGLTLEARPSGTLTGYVDPCNVASLPNFIIESHSSLQTQSALHLRY